MRIRYCCCEPRNDRSVGACATCAGTVVPDLAKHLRNIAYELRQTVTNAAFQADILVTNWYVPERDKIADMRRQWEDIGVALDWFEDRLP